MHQHTENARVIARRMCRRLGIPTYHCDRLVYVHDLPERIGGDPSIIMTKFLKDRGLHKKFHKYMLDELIKNIFPPGTRMELRLYLEKLFRELLQCKTLEAMLAEDADTLELGIESMRLVGQGYSRVREIVDRINNDGNIFLTSVGQRIWQEQKKKMDWQ
ncbi:MAG: HD domain-containing protein [bacterium]|nr:HD domain-containing protein [bacterium]